jgi:Tol biopolymer transport system component
VSQTGVLTYRTGPADAEQQQLAWFDREGTRLGLVGTPGPYRGVDLSPDGTRIAVHRHDGSGGDIWIFEPRGTATRVTFNPGRDNASPVWSPDGTLLAFGARRDGKWGLYRKSANGEDDEELLFESDTAKIPASWSPDGRHLVYWHFEGSIAQWLLPLRASPAASPATAARSDPSEPTSFISSRFSETHSQVSPDSRWVAFVSDRSGRLEVYLRPFPSGEGIWQISTHGGVTPRWRRDGRELYYVTAYDQGTLMAVSIDTAGKAPVLGAPRALFGIRTAIAPHSTETQTYHTYDVSPDGQRFLILLPVSMLGTTVPSADISVVLNWTALLEPFAPVGKTGS